jgi:N-methylhydantoinase A
MPDQTAQFTLGVDVGGTFTDLAAVADGEVVATAKVLTTYPDPVEGIMHGVARVLEAGVDPARAECIMHATTLASNAVLEGKLARTALVCTEGFPDTLWLRREFRYDIYDPVNAFPPVPVAPEDRIEAPERIGADGSVRAPLDLEATLAGIAGAVERGAEAVAICLLHSYANDAHENQVAAAVRERWPDLGVTTSSSILLEAREYERGIAAVLDAGLLPVMSAYLRRLGEALTGAGLVCPHYAVSSAGDALPFAEAALHPVLMLESGPAAGHLAACHIARRIDREVIAFDVGGTTAKIAVSSAGRPRLTKSLEVAQAARFQPGSGYPVALRSIDLHEIGSGGGSIARIDATGLVEVGPESAASDPGPACYGLGGTEPTVTDANLVLGFLNPEARLGGSLRIDRERAKGAMAAIGEEPDEASAGIRRVIDEKMAEATRLHLVEAQVDPGSRTMVASGGGGPLHAAFLADLIGVDSIYCPREAGVLSAWGLALAQIGRRVQMSRYLRLDDADFDAGWAEAWADAAEHLALDTEAVLRFERSVEMCYHGQAFSLDVEIGEAEDPKAPIDREWLTGQFAEVYRATYHRESGAGVPTITGMQLTGVLREERTLSKLPEDPERSLAGLGAPESPASRDVRFNGSRVPTAVLPWPRPGERFVIDGPVVVEGDYTAAVVPEGWSAGIVGDGDLIIRRKKA